MEENKTSKYTMEYISEFRKSISNMGTTVNNGTVVYDTSKLRREPRLNIEDIIKDGIKKQELADCDSSIVASRNFWFYMFNNGI